MNAHSSSRSGLAALIALLAVGFCIEASAQSVTTAPVGVVTLPVLSNSDTIISIPVETASEFQGTISSTQDNNSTSAFINVNGSPGWATNQYQGFYYARIRSGAKSGMYYAISANASGQLTVNSAGDSLATVASGDSISIHKFWTLNTLLPYNDASRNPLTQSLGNLVTQRRSQIIIPDNSAVGINLPALGTYYFTSSGWVKSQAGNPSANDTLLFPDEYIVIRQPSSIVADVNLSLIGAVNLVNLAIPLADRAGGSQDNAIALVRPIDIRLSDTGLGSVFVQSLGTLVTQRRDQLLVFDNTIRGINKSASKVYYRFNNQWIRSSAGNPVADGEVIAAGSGIVVRRYQNASPSIAMWSNAPTY